MRFQQMPKPTQNRFWIAQWLWARAGIIFVVLFLFFFWGLPRIGHEVLLRDDYYTFGRHSSFKHENVRCDNHQNVRIDGRFLDIYPYVAVLSNGCSGNYFAKRDETTFVRIEVRRPYTIFDSLTKYSSEMIASSFETIFYEIRPINKVNIGGARAVKIKMRVDNVYWSAYIKENRRGYS